MEVKIIEADAARELLAVYNGILTDILTAQQALVLEKTIGTNADAINATRYGNLFWTFQTILIRDATLAVYRLFDPVKAYPLRNVPAGLSVLTRFDNLPIKERTSAEKRLTKFLGPEVALAGLSDTEITALIIKTFHEQLPTSKSSPLWNAWENLKWRRDKILAHPEAVDRTTIPPVTYAELHGLIDYAKHFVGIIGPAYLSSFPHFMIGEDDRPGDTAILGRALHHLFEDAGVLPKTVLKLSGGVP